MREIRRRRPPSPALPKATCPALVCPILDRWNSHLDAHVTQKYCLPSYTNQGRTTITPGTSAVCTGAGITAQRPARTLRSGRTGWRVPRRVCKCRRDLVWTNVTAYPTADWVARQITEAFPWNEAPRYIIRDRDRIYGAVVTRRLRAMGIRDKPTAPASPWQNGSVERLIGSIRRECVDHIIVLGEAHLRRILKSYAHYYNETRTHLALHKDAPVSRPVQRTGVVRSRAILGGLHHHMPELKFSVPTATFPSNIRYRSGCR
jgi:Integrase core domain